MINGVKTIDDIIKVANVKCEETLPTSHLLLYLNSGINNINASAELKLPNVLPHETINVFDVCNSDFANNIMADILVNFIAKEIKQTDGYDIEQNIFYREFASLLNNFQSKYKHLVKPEYQLTRIENGAFKINKTKNPAPNLLRRTKLF